MTASDKMAAAGRLMLVNFGGLVALFMMGMITAGDDLSEEILMFLAVLMSLAALPVILASISLGSWARWLSFALAALFTLLHVFHIAAEHGPQGDVEETILIVFTMLLPSAGATWLLLKAKAA